MRGSPILAAGLACLALVGCAAGLSPVQEEFLQSEAERMREQPSALLIDVCIARDEVGDFYVVSGPTQDIGGYLLETVPLSFEQHRIPLAGVRQPFHCGSLSLAEGEDGELPPVVREVGEDPMDAELPLLEEEAVAVDEELRHAFLMLLRSVQVARESLSSESLTREGEADPLDLDPDAADMLLRDLGTDRVWILAVVGVDVSGGKSFATGMLSGLLSAALSGGTMIATSMTVSGRGYDIHLVDLRHRKLIWKKSVQVGAADPFDPQSFDEDWRKYLLMPIVERPE